MGASPDTADQQLPLGKKRAHYHESVKDLIDANLLKPGTRLRPLRKHWTTTALVLEDGALEVDGTRYTAVSPAAQAVSGTSPNRVGNSGARRQATVASPRSSTSATVSERKLPLGRGRPLQAPRRRLRLMPATTVPGNGQRRLSSSDIKRRYEICSTPAC